MKRTRTKSIGDIFNLHGPINRIEFLKKGLMNLPESCFDYVNENSGSINKVYSKDGKTIEIDLIGKFVIPDGSKQIMAEGVYSNGSRLLFTCNEIPYSVMVGR